MLDNSRQFELRVTVNGKPIQEYTHDTGRVYVEGRKNSVFGLQFINHTSRRVLAILSVDGLSIMDGEPAGHDSSGYIVQPWEALNVPGWRLDQDKVAEFVFKTAGESYSNQSGKGTVNTGVIGCMVFKEKEPYRYNHPWVPRIENPWGQYPKTPWGSDIWYNGGGNNIPCNSVLRGSSASLSSQNMASSERAENLGTGFGNETSFHTTNSFFNRENANVPNAMLALYYDSARNLEQMGIRVRPLKRKNVEPNPFPQANPHGCTPPPGWQNGK
jgi:hypothetical protein